VRIGYIASSYNEQRNFLFALPEHDYIKIPQDDASRLPGGNWAEIWPRLKPYDRRFILSNDPLQKVDVIHLFNGVSLGNSPWLTTFETVLPRVEILLQCHHGSACGYHRSNPRWLQLLVSAMSRDECLRLFALSDCAVRMQQRFLECIPGGLSIGRKLERLYPPQEPLCDRLSDKPDCLKDPLILTFVGREFFRKGGLEMLRALIDARRWSKEYRLNIVSSLQANDYATRRDISYARTARQLIAQHSDWITLHEELPHTKVIELMRRSHVGLLPTWADTFGYSVLEFQAAGCPVLTTDQRALPEINSEQVGWIIRVPKNELGEAIYSTPEERRVLSDCIERGVHEWITNVLRDKRMIAVKATGALCRIRAIHSPRCHADRLRGVYSEAAVM